MINTTHNFSIREITDWLLANRRNNACKGYSRELIEQQVFNAARNNTITYYAEGDKLLGVGYGYLTSTTVYVQNVLTIRKCIIKHLIKWITVNYPNYNIDGKRHSKRFFNCSNPSKFLKKLK